MPLFALALLFGLVPQATPAPAAASAALLGQWESVARTEGGIGNILEFHPDGRVSQISASMVDADYTIEGDWLRTVWKDPNTGKTSEIDTQVEFEGRDRFLERASDGTGDSWSERIGDAPRASSPIVGQWCYIYLDLLPSYREFTRDKMFNRLPVVVLRGRYSVAGDALTVQMQDQPPGQYPFRIENGLLLIRSRDGSEKQYRRPETSLLKGY